MFTFDPEGKITWANSQCKSQFLIYEILLCFRPQSVTSKSIDTSIGYEMTGHSRNIDEHSPMSFLNCVEQQDRDAFLSEWRNLTVAKEEVSME